MSNIPSKAERVSLNFSRFPFLKCRQRLINIKSNVHSVTKVVTPEKLFSSVFFLAFMFPKLVFISSSSSITTWISRVLLGTGKLHRLPATWMKNFFFFLSIQYSPIMFSSKQFKIKISYAVYILFLCLWFILFWNHWSEFD